MSVLNYSHYPEPFWRPLLILAIVNNTLKSERYENNSTKNKDLQFIFSISDSVCKHLCFLTFSSNNRENTVLYIFINHTQISNAFFPKCLVFNFAHTAKFFSRVSLSQDNKRRQDYFPNNKSENDFSNVFMKNWRCTGDSFSVLIAWKSTDIYLEGSFTSFRHWNTFRPHQRHLKKVSKSLGETKWIVMSQYCLADFYLNVVVFYITGESLLWKQMENDLLHNCLTPHFPFFNSFFSCQLHTWDSEGAAGWEHNRLLCV